MMPLTSDQIARAVLRDTKKRGHDLRKNLPGEIRRWLHSTPWFYHEYPTLEKQNELYWRVRTRAQQRLAAAAKRGRKKSEKTKTTNQLNLDLGD